MKVKIRNINYLLRNNFIPQEEVINSFAECKYCLQIENFDKEYLSNYLSNKSKYKKLYFKNNYAYYFPFYSLKEMSELFDSNSIFSNLISELINKYSVDHKILYKNNNRQLEFGKKSLMGICNITKDSFFDGNNYYKIEDTIKLIDTMIEVGVNIIDIGAESTRPGSDNIPPDDQLQKLLPVLNIIKKKTDIIISVDTQSSKVAEECLKNGADIINDISGLKYDPNMISVIKNYDAGLIIGHIRGTPKTMQIAPNYIDVVNEVLDELNTSIEYATKNGISKIIIDPGIGFGKRVHDNYELLNNLNEFRFLGYPILIGTSRKSLIGKVLKNEPNERLIGSIVTGMFALMNGADIIRVHDIKETKEALKLLDILNNPEMIKGLYD